MQTVATFMIVCVLVDGSLENVDKADAYQVAGVLVCLWNFLNIELQLVKQK